VHQLRRAASLALADASAASSRLVFDKPAADRHPAMGQSGPIVLQPTRTSTLRLPGDRNKSHAALQATIFVALPVSGGAS
jgi:hypothetical protein